MRRAALLLALVAGCRPGFGPPLSRVTAPEVAAVKFEPPELLPGASTTATAFVVGSDGVEMPALGWSLCTTPTPANDNDVVDPSCATGASTTPLGAPTTAPQPVTIPGDACRLFGSGTPPQQAGQPPTQPRAPDVTGGYYQPLRVALGDAGSIALARIECPLVGAAAATATQYAQQYLPNRNPTLTGLTATVDGAPVALTALPAGRALTLSAGWTADSVESYLVLDPTTQTLVTRAETLTVSWLAPAGTMAADRTTGDGATASNVWTTPATAGASVVFVVLRDDRGGVDFAAVDVVISP